MVTFVHNGGRIVDQDSGPGSSTLTAKVGDKKRILQCVDPRSVTKRRRMPNGNNTTGPMEVDTAH